MRKSFLKNPVFLLHVQRTRATTLKTGTRQKGNESERDKLKKKPIGKQNISANHS